MTNASVNNDRPAAMQGGGFYNRNSAMQGAAIAFLLQQLQAACRSVPIDDGPLTIVDYGSSQGRNSMVPMRMAIEELRTRAGAAVPIEIIHTDLPGNDFSALFDALVADPDSYMAATSGIFPSAIGRSFFEPIVVPGRVHLGWSTWALQWMSRNPLDAPDAIMAAMSHVPDVVAAVAEQQAADWRQFLDLRSREMRSGAWLVAGFTARSDTDTGWEWILGELWDAVCEMGNEGLFSEQERNRLTIPVCLRSIDEIKAPFIPEGQFAGFRLEHVELLKVPNPFWDAYEATGDRAEFVRRFSDAMRAWSAPTIAGLIDPSRNVTALVDELFARLNQRLFENPKKHEPYLAAVTISKTA